MSTIEIEKVEKLVDDVYNDLPCECTYCQSGNSPAVHGVRWDSVDGICHMEGSQFLFCEACSQYEGPCRAGCGSSGGYVVVF